MKCEWKTVCNFWTYKRCTKGHGWNVSVRIGKIFKIFCTKFYYILHVLKFTVFTCTQKAYLKEKPISNAQINKDNRWD